MIGALALALGDATPPASDCQPIDGGWSCWDEGVQLTARRVRGGPGFDRSRFAQLVEWPAGQFGPVWVGGQRGWQTTVEDGERGQMSRWTSEGDAWLYTASGPVDALDGVAARWFAHAPIWVQKS